MERAPRPSPPCAGGAESASGRACARPVSSLSVRCPARTLRSCTERPAMAAGQAPKPLQAEHSIMHIPCSCSADASERRGPRQMHGKTEPIRLRPARAPSGSPPRSRADGRCLPSGKRGGARDPAARLRASDGLRVWRKASGGAIRAPKTHSPEVLRATLAKSAPCPPSEVA